MVKKVMNIKPQEVHTAKGDYLRYKGRDGKYHFLEKKEIPESDACGVTWAQLLEMRDNALLEPGDLYRITDYQCTTTQEGTRSACNQFDIVLLALSANKLAEEGWALRHAGDTYFECSKLEAWRLWYCLDNDTDRFAWVDEENGKGVIYRLIDEWGNDVSYDFKNIQFLRKWNREALHLDEDEGEAVWMYTFVCTDSEDLLDGSVDSVEWGHVADNNKITSDDRSIDAPLGSFCLISSVSNCKVNKSENVVLCCADNVTIGAFCSNVVIEYRGSAVAHVNIPPGCCNLTIDIPFGDGALIEVILLNSVRDQTITSNGVYYMGIGGLTKLCDGLNGDPFVKP